MGDAALLSQCVQNLINNALKYGGNAEWLSICAHFDSAAQEIDIQIADRGIGIAPEDLPHIFEPFYNTSLPKARPPRTTPSASRLPPSKFLPIVSSRRLLTTANSPAPSF
jgi:K+-sensing histidine kinase KdpD